MARKPIKKSTPTATLRKRIELSPLKKEAFKPKVDNLKPSNDTQVDELFLSDFIAAIRRELEAVTLIATPEEKEIPMLHLSEVKLDFSYAVSSVSSEGVMVKIRPEQLLENSSKGIQKIELKFTDIDVTSVVGLSEKAEQ